MSKVAVTGVGVVSPLGCCAEEMWSKLLAGENGIRGIEPHTEAYVVSKIGAEVRDFNVEPYVNQRKLLNGMTRPARFLVAATHHALDDAGLIEPATRENVTTTAIFGLGSHTPEHYEMVPWNERPPLWYLETFPNLTLAQVSINFELTGEFNVLVNACASGTKAIVDGATQIRAGRAEVAIVGAAESKLSRRHLEGFRRIGALSRNQDPGSACRPFDRDRDGFVMGEGAGVLVLESYERARRRGAKIYGLVAGGGSAMDANRLTDPDREGRGLARAMRRALDDAELDPSAIDYINAHGTSTRANDTAESHAIQAVLGAHADRVLVSSTKSMLGHSTAASGAIEAIVCLKSLEEQRVHLTRNFERRCESCSPLDYVPGASRDARLRYAMSNSAGLGGLNAVAIFGAL